ncbi:MAG: phosphoadenylyl-sulfate reductase [Candidatus Marinamargulisbacteria bacterium]
MKPSDIDALNARFESGHAQDVLTYAVDRWGEKITLASSLGVEDQVLTHFLSTISQKMDVFVLDTGRLHQETYDVIEKTMTQYAFNYRILYPDHMAIQELIESSGPNLFYQSVAKRKACCHVRKVGPLGRALTGYSAWITGIRRAQSVDRFNANFFEWDAAHGQVKINPLIKWSKSDVWDAIKRYDIPYNALHDQGYPSIGCLPCTRPVSPGEDERSGRWWWEATEKKECGLHSDVRKES